MKKFIKPDVTFNKESKDENHIQVIIEPIESGMGTTLGNSMRRILLQSIPGVAMYALEIEGVRHEFSTIEGVREDVTAIVLNLKDLIIRADETEDFKTELKLDVSGGKVVKAKDIKCPAGIEILNKDLYIATIAPGASIKATIYVKNGRGYVTAENNLPKEAQFGLIPTDSNFSPVSRVTFRTESRRYKESSSYERLFLDVWTNGGVKPNEAISLGAKILTNHLALLEGLNDLEKYKGFLEMEKEEKVTSNPFVDMTIEELDLLPRSYNCLRRANIGTVQELIQKTEDELAKIPNMGKISVKDVKEKIENLGLSFKEEE